MRVKKRVSGKYRLSRYIILAALIFIGVVIWNFLRVSRWDGQSRFTIIIQNLPGNSEQNSTSLAVFSLEPSQDRALLLTIPDNTMMEVPYGYKTYPASSVYRLGELDSARSGGMLLTKTIELTLGIAVDKYFIFENSQAEIPVTREELQIQKHKITSYVNSIGHLLRRITGQSGVKSNISLIDLWKIWKATRNLRIDQIKLINLEDSFSTAEVTLADGSQARKIDPDLFDYLLRENLTDTRIRLGNYSIEVVNATNTEKVAGQMSRVLSHLGAHVLVKSTGDLNQKDNCQVISNLAANTEVKLLDFLTGHYGCSVKYVQDKQAQTNIKIILGEGFLK